MTPDDAPCLDPANPLLNVAPAQLATGTIETPQGTLKIWTFRTNSASVTVFLTKEDARAWVKVLAESAEADELARPNSGLVVASPVPHRQANPAAYPQPGF